ncbi:MAG: hypothetical protein LBD33_01135 [Puniceicoccales bacterium]|jgi:hypothetical protein|nr:hypothetical protein [Puniceicoccales bacterium]
MHKIKIGVDDMTKNCCTKHSSSKKLMDGGGEISVCGSVQVGHAECDDFGGDYDCCCGSELTKKLEDDSCGTLVCGSVQVGHAECDDSGGDYDCCCGSELTKIIAETDVGFGNTLYIRGAGCGLSWDKGVAMRNKDAKFWVFECDKCKCKKDFEYKFLINDEIWCAGDNFIAKCCKKNIATPKF